MVATWANPTPPTHLTSSAFISAISRRKSAMSVFVAIFDRSISTACLTAAVRASAWASVKPAAVRLLTVSCVSRALIIDCLSEFRREDATPLRA